MRFFKDENGQSLLILAAVLGIFALGFIAFAIDAGNLFRERQLAQTAADAASLAAAEEAAAGDTTNEQSVANAVATINGFNTSASSNPATVSITTPTTGNFTGSNYQETTVSMPVKTYFLGAFKSSLATVTVSASAISGGSTSSSTCVCLKGTSGTDLAMGNGSTINGTNCGLVVNSSGSAAITLTQGATIDTLSIGSVSTNWDNATNITQGASVNSSTTVVEGMSTLCNPTMPTAPTYSSCNSDPGGTSSSFTAGPSSASGTICYTALTVGANGTSDTLNPGTYVITTGALHFESGSGGKSNLGGNGVFFYLTGTASLEIDNGANVNLVAGGMTESGGTTAPTVGSYNGILIYQASADTAGMTVEGGSTAYMSGSIFAPGSAITLGNGTGSTIKGGIVASSLNMSGGGTLTAVVDAAEGSMVLTSPKLVQ